MRVAASPIESLVLPLDALRRALLRALGPIARHLVVRRETRVAVSGCLGILFAFFCAVLSPLWLLALGPVLLGVPHVVSDIRYLVVQPGLHRRPALWIAIGLPMILVTAGYGLLSGLFGVLGALLVARGARWRKLLGGAVVLPLVWLCWWAGPMADLVFAYLHNFVAVAFFLFWRPRATRQHLLPVAVFLVACVALLLGAAEPLFYAAGGYYAPASGLDLGALMLALAPGAEIVLAERLVLLYAFSQAVHYTIWLRLIPDEARPTATPPSLLRSLRALRGDLGTWLFFLFAAACLVTVAWALVDISAAREGYLRAVVCHGYLELAVAALFFVEGSPFQKRA